MAPEVYVTNVIFGKTNHLLTDLKEKFWLGFKVVKCELFSEEKQPMGKLRRGGSF